MPKKVILIVIDGLGDRPIKQLKGKTPLEAAKTPNLDKLAAEGITGIMDLIKPGVAPESDTAHLEIFSYEPEKYYTGRGPFEVAGINMKMQPGDVAFRVNLATVDANLKIIDRRAGRIESTAPFVKELDGMEIDGIKFLMKPATAYRAGLIMRGSNLSDKISKNDPKEVNKKVLELKPLDESRGAKITAQALNKFVARAHEILKNNPENEKRRKKGLLEANYLLIRGAGKVVHIPPFSERYKMKACCIAGAGLYKGIGRIMGMRVLEVKGATGVPNTNVKAKFEAAVKALKDYDFVFVHVKPTDSLGEDGNWKGKKEFIEKIDKAVKILVKVKDAFIVVTADHSTPCALKKHSADPVPVLIRGKGVRVDKVKKFGERSCAEGGLHRIRARHLLPIITGLTGKVGLFGA